MPAPLLGRIDRALRHAVMGELATDRLRPRYTNIALMHGFLLAFVGRRLGIAEQIEAADAWARAVHAAYAPEETFEEYNSPTYYGVDLFGLALWRRNGSTDTLRTLGATMEAGLWRDIGRFYHAGLRNICGPYDRAYGLDLQAYVASVGLCIALAVPDELAPLPDIAKGPTAHAHDYLFAPALIAVGMRVPPDVAPHLRTFQGPRQLVRRITSERTATTWLSENLMLGGQRTSRSCPSGPGTDWHQFHPATAHWRTPCGGVGALALREATPLDAQASENHLSIRTDPGDAVFEFKAPGLLAVQISHDTWRLPGLDVRVNTDAAGSKCAPGMGVLRFAYHGVTRIDLTFCHTPSADLPK